VDAETDATSLKPAMQLAAVLPGHVETTVAMVLLHSATNAVVSDVAQIKDEIHSDIDDIASKIDWK
jgi:hypothetical protein